MTSTSDDGGEYRVSTGHDAEPEPTVVGVGPHVGGRTYGARVVRVRRRVKRLCLHIWRERHRCGRYVECDACHDRRHAGAWLTPRAAHLAARVRARLAALREWRPTPNAEWPAMPAPVYPCPSCGVEWAEPWSTCDECGWSSLEHERYLLGDGDEPYDADDEGADDA